MAQIVAKITGDTSGLRRSLGDAENALTGFSKKMAKVGQTFTSIGTKMTIGLTLPIVGLGWQAIKMASSVEEATSKVENLFGSSASAVKKWAKDAAEAVGLSSGEALTAAGNVGNLLKGFGFGSEQAAKMSMHVTELAADLGSFNDVPTEEAVLAIGSAFRGESEPISRFGIDVREATLQQVALAKGIIDTKRPLTTQERAMAAYAQILDKMGSQGSLGDFKRTQDSTANATKIATAKLKTAAAALGEELLPVVKKVVDFVTKLVDKFLKLPKPVKKIIIVIAAVTAVIGPLLIVIGMLITALSVLAANPVTLTIIAIAAAIAGLVALVIWAYRKFDGFKDLMQKLGELFKDLMEPAMRALKDAWDRIIKALEPIMPALKEVGKALLIILAVIVALPFALVIAAFIAVTWAVALLAEGLSVVIEWTGKLIGWIVHAVAGLDSLGKGFMAVVRVIWGSIVAVGKFLGGLVQTFWELIGKLVIGLLGALGAFFSGVWNALTGFVSGFFSAASSLLGGLFKLFTSIPKIIWGALVSLGKTIWGFLKNLVSGFWSFGRQMIDALINGIRSAAGKVWSTIKGLIPSGIRGVIPGLAQGGIVTGPTVALLGEGGEKEYVIPESKLGGFINGLAAKPEDLAPLIGTGASAQGGGGGNVYITVNAGLGTDGTRISKQIVEALRNYQRTHGTLPIRIRS